MYNVIGDMNADISDSNSSFANHMVQFCQDNNFILSSKVILPADSYTYISEAWHSTSWLDHCISTASAHASSGCMNILYGAATADQIPFAMQINVEHLPVLSSKTNSGNKEKLDWSALTKEDILDYYAQTDKFLSNINLSRDAILCSDVNCKNVEHGKDLCSMCNDIIGAVYEGSEPYYKQKNKTHYNRPGWSKYVAEYHAEAPEAFKSWAMV